MEQRVSISITEGVADVRLVRADKMNALDAQMFEALVTASDRLAKETRVGVAAVFGAHDSRHPRRPQGQRAGIQVNSVKRA